MSELIENLQNTNISKCKMQELKDLLTMLKEERKTFILNDIFLDTLQEATSNKYGINKLTGLKVKDIAIREELLQIYRSKKNGDTQLMKEVLEDFNNIQLDFHERTEVKEILEQSINEKYCSILENLKGVLDKDTNNLEDMLNVCKRELSEEENELISLQNKLEEQRKLHNDSLIKLGDLLTELVDMKVNIAPAKLKDNSEKLHEESLKFNLRTQIIEQRACISIFNELPISMDAYKVAIKDLKSRQNNYSHEIERLAKELETYKELESNNNYQEILSEYKKYKCSLKTKMWMYNELKTKK